MKTLFCRCLLAAALVAVALLQTQCASSTGGGSYGIDYSGLPVSYDDPMMKQIHMQEQMSRVTRSLMPF